MTEERTFKSSALDSFSPGHWRILEHALSGRLSAENLFLVQWSRFIGLLENSDDDIRAVTTAVFDAVISETSFEVLCLPFDESAVLVIIGENAPGFLNRCTDNLTVHLTRAFAENAAPGGDSPPTYWIAADSDQISLRFRHHENVNVTGDAGNDPGFRSDTHHESREKSRLILPDANFFFFPIWNATENRLFAYLCRPFWEVPGRGRFNEASPDVAAISPERLAAIDLTIFETAGAFIQNALDNYGTAEVVIPVHASLLNSEIAVERFFGEVDRTIWAIAEQVWFEVICRAEDDESLMASAIERFARYGCLPLVRIDAKQPIPEAVAKGEVWSVGLEIDPDMAAEDKCGVLEAFQNAAAEVDYRCHVIGLETPDETLVAVNTGFDYVGSNALMAPLAAPGSEGFEAQPTDLLRTILASRSR